MWRRWSADARLEQLAATAQDFLIIWGYVVICVHTRTYSLSLVKYSGVYAVSC